MNTIRVQCYCRLSKILHTQSLLHYILWQFLPRWSTKELSTPSKLLQLKISSHTLSEALVHELGFTKQFLVKSTPRSPHCFFVLSKWTAWPTYKTSNDSWYIKFWKKNHVNETSLLQVHVCWLSLIWYSYCCFLLLSWNLAIAQFYHKCTFNMFKELELTNPVWNATPLWNVTQFVKSRSL